MAVLTASFGILAPITVIAVPFALFVWRLLAGWRARFRPPWVAATTAGLDVGIVLVALEILALTMMPIGSGSSLHLLPGSDILTEFADDGSLWQIAGNLVLLAPLALLVPLRVPALRSIPRMTVVAFAVSVVIELLQYVLHNGRITSTDDVLLNTLGAAAAATLTCGWVRHPAVVAIPAQTRKPVDGYRHPVGTGR